MPHADPIVRAAWQKAYRERNKERLRDFGKAYRASVAPDVMRAKKRAEYEKHKADYVARAVENFKSQPYWKQKYWKTLTKAKSKGAVIVDLPSIESFFKQVYTQTAAVCDYCRGLFPIRDIRIDHKNPYALGGIHCVSNLAVSCDACNHKKRAKPYDVWIASLGRKGI